MSTSILLGRAIALASAAHEAQINKDGTRYTTSYTADDESHNR